MSDYSAVPLVKKLGLVPPLRLHTINAPREYLSLLGTVPEGVWIVPGIGEPLEAAHLFATDRSDLEENLRRLRDLLDQSGFVWVSWPKKASKVQTDISEDSIREVALPLGFVDVKVCAVSDVWSGLKLVIRRSERAPEKRLRASS